MTKFLEKIVESLFGRKPAYKEVKAEYSPDGNFILSAEEYGRTVLYTSSEPYTLTTSSPLLGLFSERLGAPIEFEEKAPAMVIESPREKRRVHILYDEPGSVFCLNIEDDDKEVIALVKYGPQIRVKPRTTGGEPSAKLTLHLTECYQRRFREEQRRLNVRAHQKKALDLAIKGASIS